MLVALGCLWAGAVTAQSTDVAYPTPVASDEITGRIAPRDIGDARLTRHFYTFNGIEGDLSLAVESTGLDGDVDVYVASGLRPLARVTLYAGLSATRVSKSVYLRQAEALILRVEARTAGDAEGTYRIRLSGAFAPASGARANAPEPVAPALPDTTRRDRNVRRVTSSGARIPEPPSETAAASTTSSPAGTPATDAATTTTTEPSASARRPARRPARTPATPTRRRAPRTTQPATTPPSTRGDTAARDATDETNTGAENRSTRVPAATRTGRTPRTRTPRGSTSPRNRGTSPSGVETTADRNAPPDDSGASAASSLPVVTATRLVIETKDGGRIERDMTNVRRVTVENNQLVILRRDGRTERVPMANVLRMSIEP